MPNHRGLTIKDLEAGLSMLDQGAIAAEAFWGTNLTNFRHAMVAAMQETSDFLLTEKITARQRLQLETQLVELRGYIEFVDCSVAKRAAQVRILH